MWSPYEYDEDLFQNIFFKEIRENHVDILNKAADEHWIICVPRSGSYKTKDIDNKFILDHVLIEETNGNYSTLTKRTIILEDHLLKCDKDFNFEVEVLFEETHYIEQVKKFTVWCLERPLFVLQPVTERQNTNVMLEKLQDCIDFLLSESYGHAILKNIQELCKDFWKSHENDFEMDCLQGQKDLIGKLYSQCLQNCLKIEDLQAKYNNIKYIENLKVAIEVFMQYCLGKKLMYSINTLQHLSDSMLNKIIRNSFEIPLKDLNISSDYRDLILNAKYELYRINSFVTVLDKFNCLKSTFRVINRCAKLIGKSICLTSDEYLQIFICIILKSNISNWVANITYLKEFNFSTFDNPDEKSYLLANLEAAIEFIRSDEFLNISQSLSIPSNTLNDKVEQRNVSLFYDFYDKLKTEKNQNVMVDLLNQKIENSPDKLMKLCHPLCTCQKCLKLENFRPITKPMDLLNELGQNFSIVACIQNDVNLLEVLLHTDINIDFKDSFGKTALHYAAEKGFQDILLLLVNSKANVNVLDNDKHTPLHLACDRGQESCVKALIYSSPSVELNLQNLSGETPLFLATKWGYFDIIKILLENGASVCVKNNKSMSVYKLAPNFYVTKLFKQFGSEKSSNILKEVCNDNTENNIKYEFAESMLNFKENSVDTLSSFKGQVLLYGTRAKNAKELKQLGLLLKSIESNDLPLAYFYLGYNNTNLKRQDSQKDTQSCTKKCHPLCTCTQCLSNDQLHFSESEGVVKKNHKRQCLVKVNVNLCDNEGNTPLHIAAKYGRTEILRILLDCGAQVNVRTYKTLDTPLHVAVLFHRTQTVKELLKCGDCQVDTQNYQGYTPLYYACVQSDLKVVEYLLHNGADCQIKCAGKSILQECEEKNLFRVCKLLKESMGTASLSTKDICL